ncbi:MAG: hypothetical protein ACRDQT_00625 [Gaiellaceae bacterium]
MRLAAYAALSLAIVALAGCNGGNGGSGDDAVWAEPPEPAEDGTVSVDEFTTYQEDVEGRWERSAVTVATEFLRIEETDSARLLIAKTAPGEGGGPETVLVTLDGLFDDSVRAERWSLRLEPQGETYALTEARWAQRCQEGRGNRAFTPEPCV